MSVMSTPLVFLPLAQTRRPNYNSKICSPTFWEYFSTLALLDNSPTQIATIRMKTFKEEPLDVPEGLLPTLDSVIPPHFERAEWEKLTNVFVTYTYHSFC